MHFSHNFLSVATLYPNTVYLLFPHSKEAFWVHKVSEKYERINKLYKNRENQVRIKPRVCCRAANFFIPNYTLYIELNKYSYFQAKAAKRPSSDLASFREVFAKSKHIVVLTGAGVSAESGVPTFRGAGGFWRKWQAQVCKSRTGFINCLAEFKCPKNPICSKIRRAAAPPPSPNPLSMPIVGFIFGSFRAKSTGAPRVTPSKNSEKICGASPIGQMHKSEIVGL